MTELLVITPVKNSIDTTLQTIRAIHDADGSHLHVVFNDFSAAETKAVLEKNRAALDFELIHLEDVTETPSPNYDLVLQIAQQKALELNVPLVIVESDVIIKKDTLTKMYELSREYKQCGMLGAVTTDEQGKINFPYLDFKNKKGTVVDTSHRLSFCCTMLTTDLMKSFSLKELSKDKDWYDVFISKKSRSLGFRNYLVMVLPVVHKPHSSRPWKLLKYTNPVKYYLRKIIGHKDRI